MFTCAKIRDGASYLGHHLSCNDYYSENERTTGQWIGKGSERLKIAGQHIESGDAAFENLRRNLLPDGSGKLTGRTVSDRLAYFDFQCSSPKSISIMAVTMRDSRLIDAHRRSVLVAYGELERFAACQANTQLERSNRFTGNLISARFGHDASRSLDAQLHDHLVTVNATWDEASQTWKALTEYEMFRAIRYSGKTYQNHLAAECRKLGYEIQEVRDNKGNVTGFEISGVSPEIRGRFSKRRLEVENGIVTFEAKYGRKPTTPEIHQITVESRDRKLAEITTPEVLAKQRGQLSPDEFSNLTKIKETAVARAKDYSKGDGLNRVTSDLRRTIAHVYERQSVLTGHEILAETLNQNLGLIDLDHLKANLNDPQLVKLWEPQGCTGLGASFATKRGLALEKWAIQFIEHGQGQFDPLLPVGFEISPKLSGEQRVAVEKLLASPDQVFCLRGAAGVGKTTVLGEINRALKEKGMTVQYLAPTASAADTLRREGLVNAATLQSFLTDQSAANQCGDKPTVIVVDESGLISNKQGTDLLRRAERQGARVIFVGDSKQHTSVEAGDFLRIMEMHSKMDRAEIIDIRRQVVAAYRAAIKEMAVGQVRDGLVKLDAINCIHEGRADYLRNAATDYLRLSDEGLALDKVVCVAPTWSESHALTDEIRSGLKSRGILGPSEPVEVFESLQWTAAQKAEASRYEPGQRVIFNRKVAGFSKGENVEVTRVDDSSAWIRTTVGVEKQLGCRPEYFDVGRRRSLEVAAGDRLLIRANERGARLINGDVVTVAAVQNGIITTSDGRIIDSRKFVTFTHGYAVTSYKAQGKTADHVVIAAAHLDSKAAYVACSRGRLTCSLHTPDKVALLERLPHGTRMAALDVAGPQSRVPILGQIFERSRAWAEVAKQRTVDAANVTRLGIDLVCSGKMNPAMIALRVIHKFTKQLEHLHEPPAQLFH
jgi:conjugative relaxase-like TrwC/TraI family protein